MSTKSPLAYAIVGWLVHADRGDRSFGAASVRCGYECGSLACYSGFSDRVVIAWAFELTPEGIKRRDQIETGHPRLFPRARESLIVSTTFRIAA